MAKLVGTSDNDQPAVTAENSVSEDRLAGIAIEQGKTIFQVGSGAGARCTGVVGLEAKGLDAGITVEGKIGIRCQGTDTGLNVLTSSGVGIRAASVSGIGMEIFGGSLAARFQGDIEVVTGDIRLEGADCAEYFDIKADESAEPGSVLVINSDGTLIKSYKPYDKRVVGVVSGAGSYKPGIFLDRRRSQEKRIPITLVGKVFCKVDARYSRIECGDLLTTSHTCGCAMRANDSSKSFGAIIGKALRGLEEGEGLIPILIALQ